MNSLKRIALVEDNPRDAELVLDVLEDLHLAGDVIHLRDGAEALDYLFRRGAYGDRPPAQPAVVLLDLKMPRVDGLEVLRQLKASPELKAIPVVVLTSSREDRDLAESYRLGVNAFVVKPVKYEEFAKAIGQVAHFWALLNESAPGTVPRNPVTGSASA